ncbi:HTH domain-containing protein [Metallosphaera tengchongensis]|uniref:HTH domain-containing protein n=1 Tax=Metallosphaera tengchongensis TaxID=1532350 RepID=A0A6N0NVY0_9CREN|nr:winged helix-turn-helix transcriptional regulator [Metallosphaera tengchongensis]QKR00013.1 HTH domain-containing protein [Metallosphaera tengchongensis]
MELTPRLQDIINIIKNKGDINVQDIALYLKVSPKTAKGYIRELVRLGYVTVDEGGNIKLLIKGEDPVEKISKIIEIHESEISLLRKQLEEMREEIQKMKKRYRS